MLMIWFLLILEHLLLLVVVARLRMTLSQCLVRWHHVLVEFLFFILRKHSLVLHNMLHWQRLLMWLLAHMPLTEPYCFNLALTVNFLVLTWIEANLACFSFLLRLRFGLRSKVGLMMGLRVNVLQFTDNDVGAATASSLKLLLYSFELFLIREGGWLFDLVL